MCNDDDRAPAEEFGEVIHNCALVGCIKRVGGLVKHYVFRRTIYGACDKDALFLALAESEALVSDFCEILKWKCLYKVVYIGYACGIIQFGAVYLRVVSGDIPFFGRSVYVFEMATATKHVHADIAQGDMHKCLSLSLGIGNALVLPYANKQFLKRIVDIVCVCQ